MRGEQLGKYVLVSELGSGGMGTVWRAEGPGGEIVALKVVHRHLLDEPGFRERFQREARSGLEIRSPNVVQTLDCFEADRGGGRTPVLVLEFVEGRSLDTLVAEMGRLPEELCRHLAREVARGLAAIHEAGIVHRDLKPANVLVSASWDVKVTDLGLARQAAGDDRVSQTGLFLGTAAYAPPEQFLGQRQLDPRSDLYSLGAVLFELATGRVPFLSESLGELVRKVLRDRPPRPGALAPQITPFLEEVILVLLQKEPERRFASAKELDAVLAAGESSDWWAAAAARLELETCRPLRRVRVARETDLWGREEELAEMRAAWERARGGRGQVLLVEGEPGVGKTRLVEEFLAGLDDEDIHLVVARHDPGSAPVDAWAAAFHAALGAEDEEGRLMSLLGASAERVAELAAFLRGSPPPAGAERLAPEDLAQLLVRLVRALAAEKPTVLHVDDLHLAGAEQRALFRAIASGAGGHPVLVLGTARPGLPARYVEALTTHDHVLRQQLGRLDEDTVRSAVARHVGSGPEGEALAARIASRAGGNPYYVVEILRHLQATGRIARTVDGVWRVTAQAVEVELPDTVRELVAERLAALEPADRAVLDAGSCQGAEFDGSLAAQTLSLPRVDVLRRLGRIEHATSLVRAVGARFRFDHHIVHEVTYSSLALADRTRMHAAVGAAIEERTGAATADPATIDGERIVELCEHLLRGDQGVRALRYLDAARAALHAKYRSEREAALLERALAEPGLLVGAARAAMLLHVGDAQSPLALLGRRARREEAAREALQIAEAAGDAPLALRASEALGVAICEAGRPEESEPHLRRALDMARALGDRVAEARAFGNLGMAATHCGHDADAVAAYERSMTMFRDIGDRRGEAIIAGNLGNGHLQARRVAEALELFGRQRELAIAIGDRRGEAVAEYGLGRAQRLAGRNEEAVGHFERGLAVAQRIGWADTELKLSITLAADAFRQRRFDDARRHWRHAAARARDCGRPDREAAATVNLGLLDLALGELPRAQETLSAALVVARRASASGPEGYALHGLAAVCDERDDLARALALTEECVAVRRAQGDEGQLAETLVEYGCRLQRAGDAVAARAALDEAAGISDRRGLAGLLALSLAQGATLPGGDARAAEAALARLAEPDEAMRVHFLLWQARGDRTHLAAAKRRLDLAIDAVPLAERQAFRRNIRLHREIAAASAAHDC